jgi:ABC-2 type transport system permease protein
LSRLFRPIIRISAFIRKEIVEVLRQPRLVLSLVMGPFLILLLFGLGFHNEPRPLRTLFVTEPGSGLEHQVQEFATSLGPQLLFMGVTPSEAEARERLRRDEVDLVVITPADAYETIRDNQQARFILLHNELDPFQQDYIHVFGQVYTDEVNRRILHRITEEGQTEAEAIQESLQLGRASATAMRQALEQGDAVGARLHQVELDRNMNVVLLGVGATAALLNTVGDTLGDENVERNDELLLTVDELRQTIGLLGDIQQASTTDYRQEIDQLERVEGQMDSLETQLDEFQRIEPAILVSPFDMEVRNAAPVTIDVADYFAPSVVILLLQHLAVTIAGLSIVRERQFGTIELFRVAPLTGAETLVGKYLSYLLFGLILGLILVALLVYGLGVPFLGDWLSVVVIVLMLMFASLGIGFVISLTAGTDSQAVQYAMLILLLTVFFSGFFLSLEMFLPQVRIVSWLLPATYGIELLQGHMLRGQELDLFTLWPLAAIGVVLALLSWFLMHRLMKHE